MGLSKRRRVALVLAIVVAAVVLVIVSVLYTKGRMAEPAAEQQLQALIDQYKAAGEPILPEDFDTAPIPDETNAVVDLRAAAKARPMTRMADKEEAVEVHVSEEVRPISAGEAGRLQDLLKQCNQSLVDIRAAAAKPAADWQIKCRTPVLKMMHPEIGDMVRLSLLLNADAVVAHYQGDHAHAIESLRQGILLARITAKQRSLLAGLFACGENVVAAREAEQISPTLHIGTGTGDTTPAQVRALIDDLLQDAASHRAFHDCLLGERMCELDSCRDEVGGLKQPSASAGRTAKVVLLHNTATLLQYTTKVVGAADLPNYPAAQAGLPNIPARSGKAISSLSDSLVSLLGPSLIYALKGAFQSYTEDRLAAVALAARWYAVEHDGKLPATLNDLVPRYLPEIPLDPMAAGKPLGYIANKDRTLVYSVGESGIDEQANETRMDPEHVTGGGPHTWRARNFVVHLEPAH